MQHIQLSSRLKFPKEHKSELDRLAAECLKVVKEKAPGTIQYDWYLNDSDNEIVVRERFIDSEAMLQHMLVLGETLMSSIALGELTLEVYGSPSEALKEALSDYNVVYFSFQQGLG